MAAVRDLPVNAIGNGRPSITTRLHFGGRVRGAFGLRPTMNASRRRPRVLIVDDNRDLAKGLSLLLNVSGCDVEAAHDGPTAIAAAQARPPDVALLDVGLPGMDGFQVAERLRNEVGLHDVLIIGITCYNPDMVAPQTPAASFDHFLVKPIDFYALWPLIPHAS